MKTVPISQLETLPGYPYRPTSEFRQKMLVQSIAKIGIVTPLLVIEVRRTGWFWFLMPRQYYIIDGYRRFLAALELGFKKVPVNITTEFYNGPPRSDEVTPHVERQRPDGPGPG